MPSVIVDEIEFKSSFKTELSRDQKKKILLHLRKFEKSLESVKNPLSLNPEFRIREEEPIGLRMKAGDKLYSVELIPRCLLYFFSCCSESPYYKLAMFRVLPGTGFYFK